MQIAQNDGFWMVIDQLKATQIDGKAGCRSQVNAVNIIAFGSIRISC